LRPGDFLNIPAHQRHRLEWTRIRPWNTRGFGNREELSLACRSQERRRSSNGS
jgi:hypothetical protein